MERLLSLMSNLRARWQTRSVVLHAPAHGPGEPSAIESGVQALSEWLAAHPGGRLEVGLSARWLLCAATPQATTAQQATEDAVRQWSHYLGLDEASLPDEWVCMPVMAPGVRMVCAAPRALIDGLQETARQHGVRLQAVLPWWAFELQAQLRQASRPGEQVDQVATADALEWAWVEPGWCTRVTARRQEPEQGVPWLLDRIWMAPAEDEGSMRGVAIVASLPSPDQGSATSARCWDGADAARLLRGVPA